MTDAPDPPRQTYGPSVKRTAPDGTTAWIPVHDLPADAQEGVWAGALAEARASHLPSLIALVEGPEPAGDDGDSRVRRAIRSASLLCDDENVRGDLACALDEWTFRSEGTSVGMLFRVSGGDAELVELESMARDETVQFERHVGVAADMAEGRGYGFMSMMLEQALDGYRDLESKAGSPAP